MRFFSSLPEGRIQVATEHGAAAGQYALLMDHNAYTPKENLNEAIWRVDLSGQTAATLSFLQAEWRDERDIFHGDFTGHERADGVAISGDGVRWHPVADPPYFQPVGSWVPRSFFELVAGTVIFTSGALSAGFVIWAARASYFLTMLSTSLPAWSVVDPIPLLDAEALRANLERANVSPIWTKSSSKT